MNTFGIVDGVFVSRLIDQVALGAVGLVWPFMSFVVAIGFMLGVGGNALIAKQIGEGKAREGRENFSMITLVAFMSLLGFLAPEFILWVLGVNEFMHPMALEYMRPFLFFLPAAVLGMVLQQFLITVGKAHYGLYMALASGSVSAGLNYVFIYVMDLGLRGAALATGIGMTIPMVFGLAYFTFARGGSLYLVRFRWNFRALGRSCINGASEMVGMLSASITAVLMNNVLMDIDETGMAVASAAIMWAGMGIFSSLFYGFSSGVAPVINYNYGKNDKPHLRRAFRNSLRLIALLAVAAIILSVATVDVLLWVYRVPYYLPLHGMVRNGYLFIVAAFLLMGFNGFCTMFFTALNNGIISSVLSLFNGFIFYLIMLYTLSPIFGLNGVWAAIPAAEALQIFLTVFFLIKMGKRYGYA
jgi:Na+-driven multidrug efflux pump